MLQKADKREAWPLTFAERQMAAEHGMEPDSLAYNINSTTFAVKGAFDADRLEKALNALIERHSALRSVYPVENGEYTHRILDHVRISVARRSCKKDEVASLIMKEDRPFDLNEAPLMRCEVFEHGEDLYTVHFCIHHIIMDGSGLSVFAKELSALYNGKTLPEKKFDQEDFAVWQSENGATGAQEAFFKEMFSDGVPENDMPTRAIRPDVLPAADDEILLRFPGGPVKEAAARLGVTRYVLLMSVFGMTLGKYCGSGDVVAGTALSGRTLKEQADMFGMFVNTLPVRMKPDGKKTFTEYLRETEETINGVKANQTYPFEKLVPLLAPERNASRSPVFDVIFNYLHSISVPVFEGAEVSRLRMPLQQMRMDMVLYAEPEEEQIKFTLSYSRALYEEEILRNFMEQYFTTLSRVCEGGEEMQISALTELPERQKEQILKEFPGRTEPGWSGRTIVSLFKEQAKKTPDACAVVFREKRLSYRQLDEFTDRLAAHLASLGAGRGKAVGILIERGLMMPVGALGVLKTGAAYLPLDPNYPSERLQLMLEDAGADILLYDASLRDRVPDYAGTTVDSAIVDSLPATGAPEDTTRPEDLFILLYTSGTTGKPKGVMLTHANLVNYVHFYADAYGITAKDVITAYASFGFDAHMMDLYPTLLTGACLHIVPEEMRLDMPGLEEYFTKNGVTVAFMTTQLGRQFAESMHVPSLRALSVGGEALVPVEPPAFGLYNLYGPTECTVACTRQQVDRLYDRVPIGRPTNNTALYVVDKDGGLAPVGVPGELYIAGAQVADGYLNRPDLTAEKFIKNPFTDDPKYARIYKSGDIVRFLPDGSVDFVGRRDFQVKIRGFRIELTEVEEIIRRFPGITDATVAAFNEPSGGKFIAAYITADTKIAVEELNAFIRSEKPAYMVPAVTMQIDKIPLNVNGKVDKRKLPAPEFKPEEGTGGKDRAMTRLETEIAEVLEKILGHKGFGVETEFTYAGLSSLSAIRFATELNKRFGFSPNVKELQNGGNILTVENALVDFWRAAGSIKKEPEKAQTARGSYPLTETQLGIWLECMMDEESDMYNIPLLLKLDPSIDADRLEKAVLSAVEAHPFIKCRLESTGDGSAVMLPREDFIPKVKRTQSTEAEVKEHFSGVENVISPKSEALLDLQIIGTEESLYLWMNFHHIVMDGTSVNVFFKDVERAYLGETLDKESYTSFDLSLDEQTARSGEAYSKAKAYYDSVFSGVSVNSLPAPDVTDMPESNADKKYILPEPDKHAVEAFCEKNGVTPNALFTAAFGLLLGKVNGQEEAVFSSIYNGRTDPRTFTMLGMLVKTYPIYMALDPKQETDAFVQTVRDSIRDLTSNDLYSFAEASRAYGVNSDMIFAYQGDEFTAQSFAGRPARYMDMKLRGAKAPLNVDVLFDGERYVMSVEYDAGMYAEQSIAFMAEAYGRIVAGLIKEKTLADIDPAGEKALAFMEEVNDTAWPVPFRPACRLLEDSAEKYPDRLAVITPEKKLTYRQLNSKANRLANALIENGVKPGDTVAVMLPRSANVYVTRQGVLKAGAAFLPVDPKYPDERIAYILEDSGTKTLVTDGETAKERGAFLQGAGCAVYEAEKLLENENETAPGIVRAPDDLCYCIYTSGSTGKPKGVMLSQKNLVNFTDANPKNREILGYTEHAHVSLAQAAFTFDVSVMEEFIPLANGMTICMAGEEEIHNPMALAALMQNNLVDMMSCTPSFLNNMIDMNVMRAPLARVMSYDFGAEAFTPSLFSKIRAINPEAYIMNGYGPTEATISCTMDAVMDERRITIGRPNGNVKAYVVDEKLHILPPRMCGELVICGDGVGIGYIGRDDLNKEKFITLNGLRAYRTGDLAEYTHDGQLLFHGRTDNQVKLRGLRVELGEIENAINAYPGVLTSIVRVRGEGTSQFLAAWFTASKEIDTNDLQTEIGKTLTHYMVPSVFMQLPSMPLTANGKIDTSKLPKPEYTRPEGSYTAPANSVEEDFCKLFEQILGLERAGAEDDFFELGGTSLSASRIAMFAIEKGYGIVYADVFKHPTPRGLASLVLGKQEDVPQNGKEITDYDYSLLAPALKENVPENLDEIKPGDIGNVLITGTTGFLAIHVLWNYLREHEGTAYCLFRRGKLPSVEERLRSMLVYYFSDDHDRFFKSGRIRCIEGDITDPEGLKQLDDIEFDTLINCAALVKHFDAGNALERVNVQGVKNLIDCCMGKKRRLIQISTVSVAGESVNGVPDAAKRMGENELFFGQLLENDYIRSKFLAERAVLDAVSRGLDAKIMRVGNLMGRDSDGEFQINFRSSGFMRQLRGYRLLGAFPVSGLGVPQEFSEISKTAQAILRLAGTDKKFTVFHPCNNHLVTMADVIDIMQQCGLNIDVVPDDVFVEKLGAAAEDPAMSEAVGGLIAYKNSDSCTSRSLLDASIAYTTSALFRLGFKWPITGPEYLHKLIEALEGLGMF